MHYHTDHDIFGKIVFIRKSKKLPYKAISKMTSISRHKISFICKSVKKGKGHDLLLPKQNIRNSKILNSVKNKLESFIISRNGNVTSKQMRNFIYSQQSVPSNKI